MTTDPLLDFKAFPFEQLGQERTVYRKGNGPAVIVMHEVPGISTEVIRFARKVVDAGFTVFMPHLFGIFGTDTNEASRLRELAKLCVSREWHVLAENRSSPIADWLRGLAAHVHEEIGGAGVSAVGIHIPPRRNLPPAALQHDIRRRALSSVSGVTWRAAAFLRDEGMKVWASASRGTCFSAAQLASPHIAAGAWRWL